MGSACGAPRCSVRLVCLAVTGRAPCPDSQTTQGIGRHRQWTATSSEASPRAAAGSGVQGARDTRHACGSARRPAFLSGRAWRASALGGVFSALPRGSHRSGAERSDVGCLCSSRSAEKARGGRGSSAPAGGERKPAAFEEGLADVRPLGVDGIQSGPLRPPCLLWGGLGGR